MILSDNISDMLSLAGLSKEARVTMVSSSTSAIFLCTRTSLLVLVEQHASWRLLSTFDVRRHMDKCRAHGTLMNLCCDPERA
jgi:hypothetical protein